MGVSVGHSPMIVNGTKDPLRRGCVLGAVHPEKTEDDYAFRTRGRKENLRLRRDEQCLESVELIAGRANRR